MSIKIRFLGAARSVTGSRYLVETKSARVLIDCGLYQERELQSRNWEDFIVEPSTIDAVVLTHAHLDHCGLLPRLAAKGFGGSVFATPATADIVPIVLEDAARIQAEDLKYKKKRHRKEGRARDRYDVLYTLEEVKALEERLTPTDYGMAVPVAEGVQALFLDAGHILGSASVRLLVKDGDTTKTILFSGDIGRHDRPILRDPDPLGRADVVVTESTYGDRLHEDTVDIREQIARVVNETVEKGGNIVIPSFAIERAQELLYHFAVLRKEKRIPQLLTFLDSPMAVKVTEVFRRHRDLFDEEARTLLHEGGSPFSFDGLKMTRSTEESKAINTIRGSCIIIAGSGMCTGGRIKHHLVHNIDRPESAILFVGYQASGTLGRHIVEGEAEVRIFGQYRKVRARVAQVHGFSGHADRDELLAWLQTVDEPPAQVYVAHGGENVSRKYAAYIREQTGWPAEAPAFREIKTVG